jgi:sensor c-di-GMP phosphodiesterase-like protein
VDEVLLQIVALIAGTGFSTALAWFARKLNRSSRRRPDEPEKPSLVDRINALRDNLDSSAAIITEINAELHLQTASLDRIRAEAEENQRLAALSKDEADAVRAVIESAQAKGEKPARRQQIFWFFSGLLASIPIGIVVNFLYDLIAH